MKSKTYIICLYRYEEDNPEGLLGTIEDVESNSKDRFKGIEGLWERIREFQQQAGNREARDMPFKGDANSPCPLLNKRGEMLTPPNPLLN